MKSLKTNCGESISRMKLNPPKINLYTMGDGGGDKSEGKGLDKMFVDLCNFKRGIQGYNR